MSTPQRFPMKPSASIKTRFTCRFLRALKRLMSNHKTPTPSSSSPNNKKCFRRYCCVIKEAADASMASAVGSRRAWSRSMLRKIRRRHQAQGRRALERRRRSRSRGRGSSSSSDSTGTSGTVGDIINEGGRELLCLGSSDELRNLVPGGEAMDLYSLLDETAHYIKCLTTQVQVMRNIVNLCPS